MNNKALNCWYLSGPTASGKTRVGVELAKRLNAEVVSLDSMALYRGMDIGTAKPSEQVRGQVPHHLIDVVDPDQNFSLHDYLEAAQYVIHEIRNRGHEVLFVGGTPLYLKGLLRGICSGPAADWEFRAQVQQEVSRLGTQALHERLKQVDPLSAERLHPNDVRRIVRALEVYKHTGRPISHSQIHFDDAPSPSDCRVFVLDWSRDQLHERIEDRVNTMFDIGLVGEVQGLRGKFPTLSRTALQAVSYREVLDHLDGICNLAETIERIKIRTRRFAKRQSTWFRSLPECRTVPVDHASTVEQITEQILDSTVR